MTEVTAHLPEEIVMTKVGAAAKGAPHQGTVQPNELLHMCAEAPPCPGPAGACSDCTVTATGQMSRWVPHWTTTEAEPGEVELGAAAEEEAWPLR